MYEVGDKLRIRQWDDMVNEYSYSESVGAIDIPGSALFLQGMRHLCGQTFTVSGRTDYGSVYKYYSEEGLEEDCWAITDGMLEPIDDTAQSIDIKITNDEFTEILKI